jgi:hypothetical protein
MKIRDPRYQRGRDFETKLAKIMRQKGITAYRDRMSGAGQHKADLRIPGQQLHLEAKSHDKIRLGEFWAQTISESGYKTPLLVVDLDGYTALAVLRFEDLCDLVRTIQDDTETITELRSA